MFPWGEVVGEDVTLGLTRKREAQDPEEWVCAQGRGAGVFLVVSCRTRVVMCEHGGFPPG